MIVLEVIINYLNFSMKASETLAHISGMGVAFIWNFVLHKYFSFKDRVSKQGLGPVYSQEMCEEGLLK